MAKLCLVRHARAAVVGDLRLPGPDLPLLPEGVAQAAAVAARLAPLRPEAIHVSDAARARQTAAPIAERLRLPLVVDPALREIDLGAWAGRAYADVVAADLGAARFFADPTAGTPPGGEPLATAAGRVFDALRALAAAHPGGAAVVAVGHAGSLRLALTRALGMPLAAYWRLRLDLAALTVLEWTDGGPVLERLNDTNHLPPSLPPPPQETGS